MMATGNKRRFAALAFAVILCSIPTNAQIPQKARFSAYRAVTLAAAAEVVTVQQPASGSKTTVFEFADVYWAVVCEVTLERDGTAATGTAITAVGLGFTSSNVTNAFHTSDVGAGTVIKVFVLAAGETISIDLNGVVMQGDSTAVNLTFRTNSITGDVKIWVRWREE